MEEGEYPVNVGTYFRQTFADIEWLAPPPGSRIAVNVDAESLVPAEVERERISRHHHSLPALERV